VLGALKEASDLGSGGENGYKSGTEFVPEGTNTDEIGGVQGSLSTTEEWTGSSGVLEIGAGSDGKYSIALVIDPGFRSSTPAEGF
jgi:hypothetical protein